MRTPYILAGGEGFDVLVVGSDGDNQTIDMSKTAFQEIEGVRVNSSDTDISIALDKIVVNDTAGEANGQFVCTGANSIDLTGWGWELKGTTTDMAQGLKDAYEAQNLDTSNLYGYKLESSDGKEVTIWSDLDQDNINFPTDIA